MKMTFDLVKCSNNNEISESSILSEFRSLVAQHPKTNKIKCDDSLLIKFLRSRDYDLKESMKILINYIGLISERSDIFSWREEIGLAARSAILNHYPVRNSLNGCQVVLTSPRNWNTSQLSIESLISYSLFACEMSLMDEDAQRFGIMTIIDARDISWNHVYWAGLSNLKLSAYLTDSCVPCKMVSVHVLFENRLTDVVASMVKPFLDEKIVKQIVFHGNDLDSLYHFIPKSDLPPHFGGVNQEFSDDYYYQQLTKHKDQVINLWNSLRVSKN